MPKCLFLLVFLPHFTFAQVDSEYDDNLPINKIQVLGSHNSYKRATDQGIWKFIKAFDCFSKGDLKPSQQMEYNHIPLDSQLHYFGLRQFEIDIYNDPKGGRYYNRQGNALRFRSTKSNVDALLWGGMKVLHISDIDYNTNYYTFKDALRAVNKWSNEHPTHLPIYLMIELKNDGISDYVPVAGFKKALKFDEKALDDLKEEIYSVFSSEHLLKPDDVRGNYSTLREAVITKGFPLLKEARGKIVFILYAPTEVKKIITEKHPSFRGLPYFTYADKNSPEAAFLKYDDPKKHFEEIKQCIDSGFIVRSRADADTREARDNDYSSFEGAKKAGVQLISTDFYIPFKGTGYVLKPEMLRK